MVKKIEVCTSKKLSYFISVKIRHPLAVPVLRACEPRDDVDGDGGGGGGQRRQEDEGHQAVHQGRQAVQGDAELQLDVRDHLGARAWSGVEV